MPRTLAPDGPVMRLVTDSAPQAKNAERAHWRSPAFPRRHEITALARACWYHYADTGPYVCPGTVLPTDPRHPTRRTLIIDLSAIPEAHTWDPATPPPETVSARYIAQRAIANACFAWWRDYGAATNNAHLAGVSPQTAQEALTGLRAPATLTDLRAYLAAIPAADIYVRAIDSALRT